MQFSLRICQLPRSQEPQGGARRAKHRSFRSARSRSVAARRSRVCLPSSHSRGCRMATSCPADSATTGFFLDGAAAACPQLLSYCSGANGLSAHGCTIAGLCPVTCGACASQQFCDVVDTQIQLGGATATCAQLASLCNDATHGALVRSQCPQTCGCGYCPPPPPSLPPSPPPSPTRARGLH